MIVRGRLLKEPVVTLLRDGETGRIAIRIGDSANPEFWLELTLTPADLRIPIDEVITVIPGSG